MTQLAEFVLVLVTVAVASIWALAKGHVKWFLLIVGAFAAWVVLPTVILQTEWGYYREDGVGMGSNISTIFKADSDYWAKQAPPLAAEVCGDAEGFDVNDSSLQWTTMPEQSVVKHFFFYSKYSNIIWLGVGWNDRFCLARYLVTDRRERGLYPFPIQLFPYPFFPWFSSHSHNVELRLIERLPPPPTAPEGVRSLLPGQCVTGEIAKGETARFQVQVPNFDQKIGLDAKLECIYGKDFAALVEWSKNGRAIAGLKDESDGGGLYQITLRAPTTEAKPYSVGVFWGVQSLGCVLPKGWWNKCRPSPDPDAASENPD
jgi:hypothetical protein